MIITVITVIVSAEGVYLSVVSLAVMNRTAPQIWQVSRRNCVLYICI